MEISYDKTRGLIDFNMERGEDHFAFTIEELQDVINEARKRFSR